MNRRLSRTWRYLAALAIVAASAMTVPPTVFGAESGPISPLMVTALTRQADAGNAGATYSLAILGLEGALGGEGRAAAVGRLQAAAARHHPEAAFVLGGLYESGTLVPRDPFRAVEYFTLAAGRGDAKAQNALALLLMRGEGVEQNVSRAAGLLRQAATKGLPEAKANLGVLYIRGHGVPRDDARGTILLREAAGAGLADAQFNYGWLLDTGTGVPQDRAAAREWYEKAARNGSVRAQFNLARLLIGQKAESSDYVGAVKWLVVVAHGADPALREMATDTIPKISQRLTPAQKRVAGQGALDLLRELERAGAPASPAWRADISD